MYLRGKRILDLVKFIDGYIVCESFNKIDSEINDFLNKLTIFIHNELSENHPAEKGGNYHWYQMIEILSGNNIETEIPIFFELYDKFKFNDYG